MISMSSSSRTFASLADYLARGKSGDEPDRVAWSASRNLPTNEPELTGKIMRATAAQNDRVRDPVYHLALSFDPTDQVDRATMERVADRVIAALHLQEHQILIVAHGDRAHPHMHLLVNRVHPETGRVWNRWQDRPIIQQVLREEEKALGLRRVPGRLTSREQLGLELDEGRDHPRSDHAPEVRTREEAVPASPNRPTRIEELATHLRSSDRVVELTRDCYSAEIETIAARARAGQLEEAARRKELASNAFDQALTGVYKDPTHARREFLATVERSGLDEAARTLRERPEQLGPVITVERTRAFGLGRTPDEVPARTAAVGAAAKGRDMVEAEKAADAIALRLHPRAPETTVSPDPADMHARVIPAITVPATRIEPALEMARTDVQRATAREAAIKHELRALPDRGDLERRILDLLDRMTPRELRQLRRALTAPQVAVVLKLKAALRDTLLGRDEPQQQR